MPKKFVRHFFRFCAGYKSPKNGVIALAGTGHLECTNRGWNNPVPRCTKSQCPSLQPTEGMAIAPIHCQAGGIFPGNKCQVSLQIDNLRLSA